MIWTRKKQIGVINAVCRRTNSPLLSCFSFFYPLSSSFFPLSPLPRRSSSSYGGQGVMEAASWPAWLTLSRIMPYLSTSAASMAYSGLTQWARAGIPAAPYLWWGLLVVDSIGVIILALYIIHSFISLLRIYYYIVVIIRLFVSYQFILYYYLIIWSFFILSSDYRFILFVSYEILDGRT